MMRRNIVIIALTVPLVFLLYVCLQLFVPVSTEKKIVEIEVPEGATYRQALSILAGNHLVRDRNVFIMLGKIFGVDRRIRAGYYAFSLRMNPWEVFIHLRDGRVIEYDVTILEGDSIVEIANRLSASRIIKKESFERLARDEDFLSSLSIDAPSIEGYLFPQTYKFPKGSSPESVLKTMVNHMRDAFSGKLRERAKQMGWSENDVLTLASIIEREAVVDEERTLISAVYHNRIKQGMPLQADPTAVYGVKSYRSKITRKDLAKQTSFNTYVIRGLPPGPIASPSIKSIYAALYPADVPYLYFVSQGDRTHYFSKTLSEHNAAISRIKGLRGS